MKVYEVLSPPYESGGGYLEPPEYGCDYETVHAQTAKQAKWCYYRKAGYDSYARMNYVDGRHPLTDITASQIPETIRPTLCVYEDCDCTERKPSGQSIGKNQFNQTARS